MKIKIILSIIYTLFSCLNICAQDVRTVDKFNNNELQIYYEFDNYNRLFDHHRVVFVNKTNNRMRVTYNVDYNYYGLLNGAYASDVFERSKTRTIYIEPQSINYDSFVETNEKDWDNFMQIANRIGYRLMNSSPTDPAQMIVNYKGFKLKNYGVEEKSYRTSF